jgi:iron complex outermembrane receptor protein
MYTTPAIASSQIPEAYLLDSRNQATHDGEQQPKREPLREIALNDNELAFFELPLQDLLQLTISTASRVSERMTQSTSNTAVIDQRQIKALGATSLNDILKHLPGFGVQKGRNGQSVINLRGINSEWSGKLLYLLNGHRLSEPMHGSTTSMHLDLIPVAQIERIEFVRGASSSLYGSDAFVGIINIITRIAQDEQSPISEFSYQQQREAGSSAASTYNLLLSRQASTQRNALDFTINLNLVEHEGNELYLQQDIFGNAGNVANGFKQSDIYLQSHFQEFTVSARIADTNFDGFYGLSGALPENTQQSTNSAFIDLQWQKALSPELELTLHTSIDQVEWDNEYELFPAGSIPAGSPLQAWNESGQFGNPQVKTLSRHGEALLNYSGLGDHVILAGVSLRKEILYGLHHYANFDPAPLDAMTDVSAYHNWGIPRQRLIKAIFAEDLWHLNEQWHLSFSARYDDYNDTGSTFNPRASALWNLTRHVALSFSYASAFRAPAFTTQDLTNNPTFAGNKALKEETVDTLEASLLWKFRASGLSSSPSYDHLRLSYYHNEIDGLIIARGEVPPIPFTNFYDVTVDGLELEGQLRLRHNLALRYSYSYTRAKLANGRDFPDSTRHKGNAIMDMKISNTLSLNVAGVWQSRGVREAGDMRPSLAGYGVVDISLHSRVFDPGVDVSVSINNALDKHYAYPSSIDGSISDLPAPGRTATLGIKLYL